MGFRLVRVDDRLLHGQVVYGWGQELEPRAYIIADDEAATDLWEREAFEAAAPPGVTVTVETVAAFARSLDRPARDHAATVVLLRRLETLERLATLGFRPPEGVNLGGLHARSGTRELLPYLHLSPRDEEILRVLLALDYPLFAQDLPSSTRWEGRRLRALIDS